MLKQSLTYLLIPMQTASPTTRCKVQHIRELLEENSNFILKLGY